MLWLDIPLELWCVLVGARSAYRFRNCVAPQGNSSRCRRAACGTCEIAPELTGHGLPLVKCEAYNRVYDQPYGSS